MDDGESPVLCNLVIERAAGAWRDASSQGAVLPTPRHTPSDGSRSTAASSPDSLSSAVQPDRETARDKAEERRVAAASRAAARQVAAEAAAAAADAAARAAQDEEERISAQEN